MAGFVGWVGKVLPFWRSQSLSGALGGSFLRTDQAAAHQHERPFHASSPRRRNCRWHALRANSGRGIHAIPALHSWRRRALRVALHASRPGVVELLPGLERIAGVLGLPGDSIDQAAPFEHLAQSLAVIGPVGEIALLVAHGISASPRRLSCTLAGVITAWLALDGWRGRCRADSTPPPSYGRRPPRR